MVAEIGEGHVAGGRQAQEGDRTGDRDMLNLRCARAESHQGDAVAIGLLGGRERDQRAAIPYLPAAQALRPMEMAECHVARLLREHVGRHRVIAAHQNASLRALRFEAAGDVEMTGDEERQAGEPGPGRLEELPVKVAHRPHDRRGLADAPLAAEGRERRQAGGGGVGDGEHLCRHLAAGRPDRHEVAFKVDGAVAAADIADDVDADGFEQRARRFQASGGIVVARGDDDGHLRPRRVEARHQRVEACLRFPRRVLAIEHVARHDEGIDLALHHDALEAAEHGVVLALAGEAAQGLADMPIARMENADH